MARLRASWRTSLPVVQQPRNPQSESIARTPYQTSPEERRSRRTTTGHRPRSWWSEGRGPRGTRVRTARAGLRTGQACQRGWTAYGTFCRHKPEVGAVCPNWARSDLCGGRSVMSVPTAIYARPGFAPRAGATARFHLATRFGQGEGFFFVVV